MHLVSARSKHLRDGEKHFDGRCVYDSCTIYIDKSLPEPVREDTLFHELVHALFYVVGMQDVFKGDGETEEHAVRRLVPTMHRLFLDLGFRFPKVT